MSLEEKVMNDLKEAMRSKDEKALRALRAIKSAIINTKTAEGFSGTITADDEIKLLQKLVKQRKDSLEIFTAQNREDLATKERDEVEVIEKYLPAQLSAEELHLQIKKIIEDLGATSPSDMGKIMKEANVRLAGKADGKAIAGAVKEILSAR